MGLWHACSADQACCEGTILGENAETGRTSLRTLIIPDRDHSLEFVSWAVAGGLPEGLKILFDQVERR